MTDRASKPPRAYCGAPPPEGRTSATCVLGADHKGDQHRNLDGLRWPVTAPQRSA